MLIGVAICVLSSLASASSTYLWGTTGDVPVSGDFDGDGKADLAVFRPSTGQWFVLSSLTAYTTFASVTWGQAGDVPMAGDYGGVQQASVAVYRPSTGQWLIYGTIFPVRFECLPSVPGCLNY